MVEYFFHKSCILAEDKLIDVDMKNMRASREEKAQKAHGILKIIEPCAHVLEVNFPLQRDDGSYEMINGYRAQHSHHRCVHCHFIFESAFCCILILCVQQFSVADSSNEFKFTSIKCLLFDILRKFTFLKIYHCETSKLLLHDLITSCSTIFTNNTMKFNYC